MISRVDAFRKRVFYGWWIVTAGSAAMLTSGLHTYGFSVFFLPISQSLGLSRATTSVIFSAAQLEGGVGAPLGGFLVDRLGPRIMLIAGASMAGLGYILLGLLARDFWSFFFIYVVLLGTGFSAGFFPSIMTAYNSWFRRYRGTAMGTLVASNRAGAFLLVPLISFLVLHLGWETGAVIAGAILLAVVVPLALVFRRSPESMGLLPDGARAPLAAPQLQPSSSTSERRYAQGYDFTLSQAVRTPTFWVLTIAQGVRMAALGAILVHAIPMLVWKGAGRQEAANLLGLMALLGVPGGLLVGLVADRLNKRVITAIGILIGAGALLVLNAASARWHLYGFILLFALSESTHPAMIALVGDFYGRRSFATLRGVMQFFSTFGSFSMPVLAGWIWDRTGAYTWALIPFSIAAGVAAVLYLVMRPPRVPASAPLPAGAKVS